MSDNLTLLKQLANKAKIFHSNTGISQALMAKAIGMADGNYSAFLSGKRGIGAESLCALLKFMSMSKREAVATFSKPVVSSQILKLQERGKALQFDNSGWVAREGSTDDPVNSTDITNTTKAKREAVSNLLAVLAQLDEVTRKTVVAAITKAYPNPNGTTPSNGQRLCRL